MAVIDAVTTQPGTREDIVFVTTWADMATGDTGEPIRHLGCRDRCVQFSGTFGGATVVLQGTNGDGSADDAVWATLRDNVGVAISATAAAIRQLGDIPLWIRPSVSGGSGAAIDVVIVERRGLG